MWMADLHIICAPKEKRAKVAGCIERLQHQLDQRRADPTHIDGVLRLFAPDSDPELIRPMRTYARRTRYFARNESHSHASPGDEAPRSIPLHRRKPVPTAEVDPGFRRESEEGDLLNHLNGSEH
jgi:hypothetical protein